MKIVYIAHPIAGDVLGNLERIANIVRHINLTEPDIVPLVPYYADVVALDDTNPVERERGRKNGLAMILQKRVDEVWCYGGTISPGMEAEIDAADKVGLPVRVCGHLLPKEFIVKKTRAIGASELPSAMLGYWQHNKEVLVSAHHADFGKTLEEIAAQDDKQDMCKHSWKHSTKHSYQIICDECTKCGKVQRL